jgi:hypothetical protein
LCNLPGQRGALLKGRLIKQFFFADWWWGSHPNSCSLRAGHRASLSLASTSYSCPKAGQNSILNCIQPEERGAHFDLSVEASIAPVAGFDREMCDFGQMI